MIQLNYPQFWLKKGILSFILIPFSWVYIFLGCLRQLIIKPIKLPSFVICVGNMSVGGTGKTQVTKWLAQHLQKNNYNFLIVTKAYGAYMKGAKLVDIKDSAQYIGDESKLLSQYGPVLAAKTIKDALPIIEQIKPDIIIFDDGMQNPKIIKDFTILVIDTLKNVGNNRIIPAGPLRMNLRDALNKSDIIIFTGNSVCQNYNLLQKIINSAKPLFKSTMQIKNKIDINKNYYAFAGIGNPNSFFKILAENRANVFRQKVFPDHHNYTSDDIRELINEAEDNALQLITTQKDYVKMDKINNIEYIDVDLCFDHENQLLDIINEKIKAHI